MGRTKSASRITHHNGLFGERAGGRGASSTGSVGSGDSTGCACPSVTGKHTSLLGRFISASRIMHQTGYGYAVGAVGAIGVDRAVDDVVGIIAEGSADEEGGSSAGTSGVGGKHTSFLGRLMSASRITHQTGFVDEAGCVVKEAVVCGADDVSVGADADGSSIGKGGGNGKHTSFFGPFISASRKTHQIGSDDADADGTARSVVGGDDGSSTGRACGNGKHTSLFGRFISASRNTHQIRLEDSVVGVVDGAGWIDSL